ncbi:hypothetical protein AVEN_175557-1 [Araneus ventricosus]|uniref:Histone-lysine N-methyltransferase SETMAR n=1 Tax=Araneus ventricosus TaxID=182803 RepID=A0A4Y2CMY0_ARAVE|nr:hypothetical protein AVEN_175557-1 [Araneus ventricosus]
MVVKGSALDRRHLIPELKRQKRLHCPIKIDKHLLTVNSKTLRQLRRAILTSRVVLIHDNALPHSAVVTQQLLELFKWAVSDHPAYSSDITTSDFHLFFELKNWIGGQIFQNNEELQSNFQVHLTSLATTCFKEGIGNLVHLYEKYLNLYGNYVEK